MKNKTLLLLLLLLLSSAMTMAQERLVTGQLFDPESKEPIEQASVQLLNADSTYAGGTLSNEQGVFKLRIKKDGKYRLRISSIGYQTIVKRIVISDGKNLALGKMEMKTDAVVLKETGEPVVELLGGDRGGPARGGGVDGSGVRRRAQRSRRGG